MLLINDEFCQLWQHQNPREPQTRRLCSWRFQFKTDSRKDFVESKIFSSRTLLLFLPSNFLTTSLTIILNHIQIKETEKSQVLISKWIIFSLTLGHNWQRHILVHLVGPGTFGPGVPLHLSHLASISFWPFWIDIFWKDTWTKDLRRIGLTKQHPRLPGRDTF